MTFTYNVKTEGQQQQREFNLQGTVRRFHWFLRFYEVPLRKSQCYLLK